MDSNKIVQQIVNLTNRLNAIALQAKKIWELPWQTILNPASQIHVSNGTDSERITIQQILDAALSYRQNQLISATISVDENDITVDSGAAWIINNINHELSSDFNETIPYAETGYTRNDILVGDEANLIYRIVGPETEGISPTPNVPINTVLVTVINVTDSTIGNAPPLVGEYYVLKSTISEIRSLSGTLLSNNFYTIDLGKEGEWYYDSSDTTSADNTGTILVTTDGKRIKRIFENNVVFIEWFDGLSDSEKCQNAVDFLIDNNGGKIKFLTKKYIWTETVYINPVDEIPISLEGVSDYQRDTDDGSDNNGTVIQVSSAMDCFRINLDSSGASVKDITKQYFGFSSKNIMVSGKGGVTGTGGVGGIIGFKMFRTRSKFENMTGNRIDYLIYQSETDVNAAQNYCDMSVYNNIKIVQSRWGGCKFSVTDGSVINGYYFENPNTTCKYGLEIFSGSATTINGLLLGYTDNHALISGGALVRLNSCNGLVINGSHLESSKFETLFDIYYCLGVSITGIHTRFYFNNGFTITNSKNITVSQWDSWASPEATYSDLKIIGTEAGNGNITIENFGLTTYPARADRTIVLDNPTLGSTIRKDRYLNLSGVIDPVSAKASSEYFSQKLRASANNDVLSTIISRTIFNDNSKTGVRHYSWDAEAPIIIRANSGSVFEGRDTSDVFKSRITGGGFLYINRINGLDATGTATNTYFEYISDDLVWRNAGVQRIKMFASDGRMIIGNSGSDSGHMLQVFGVSKMAGLIIDTIPNTSASTYYIMTLNTSTGVVEKIASNIYALNLLTGYTSGAGTISSTDSVLQAIQKLNGNDALKAPLASPALTGTPTAPTPTTSTGIANKGYVDGLIPKVYKAIVSQVGTADPTVVVIANTLGGTVVWTRTAVGNYRATLVGAFPAAKTFPITGTPTNGTNFSIGVVRGSDDYIFMDSFTSGTLTDSTINNQSVSFEVYP